MNASLDLLLAAERRATLRRACVSAAIFAAVSVVLLGLSGWFIAAAAAAGAAGPAAAHAFNYLLPSAAIRLLAIARTGSRYGERLFGHEAALFALARVRPALLQAVTQSPPERALGLSSGEATASMIEDVAVLETSLVQRTAPWSTAAAVIAGGALLACAGLAPLVSTVLCLLALYLGSAWLARRLPASAARVRESIGMLKDDLAMLAAAEPELRCYRLEARAIGAITESTGALDGAQRQHARLMRGFDLLQAMAAGLAAALALGLARDSGAALTALAALVAAMSVEGVAPLLRRMAQRGGTLEATRRVDAILTAVPAPAALEATPFPAPTGDRDISLCGTVRTRLEPGSRLAIVGPSGSGKTVLLETLIGLRPAVHGLARLGKRDIANLSADELRSCFAWLPQDAVLLAGTVRDNLLLAQAHASEESLWGALHDAVLDERVRALPDGPRHLDRRRRPAPVGR